jgi:hypothetical protein
MTGVLSLLLVPVLILWSLFYGVLGGIIFRMIALFEYWIGSIHLHLVKWKRYPLRSNNALAAILLTQRMSSRPVELLPLTYSQLTQERHHAPFPIFIIFTTTLIALACLPYAVLSGALQGPVFVYRQLRGKYLPALNS